MIFNSKAFVLWNRNQKPSEIKRFTPIKSMPEANSRDNQQMILWRRGEKGRPDNPVRPVPTGTTLLT